MRRQLGVIVAACLYYSGLVALSRTLMARSGKQLIILNYHHASGGDLRRHLLYLRRHYRMMHLETALEDLYASTDAEKEPGRDRRTPLVLTFDDGYHDNYSHAFSLACELQIPITIFLIPGYVDSGDYFWWGEGCRLVRRASVDEITLEGSTYRLSEPGERVVLSQLIDSRLRYATSIAEREVFLAKMRDMLAVPSSVSVEEEGDLPLTWAEVHKMEESGWVSFGAHTMHHPVLAYLADPAEVKREVAICRRVLEQQLGHPVRSFAYPIGRFEHIGSEAIRAVREAGYDWAVTTVHGINTPQSDPYRLRRILGDVTRHWLVMAAETSGIWHLLSPLWKVLIGKGEDG
jgi:peptidoglycan/xylan/chitin deacetylase (PgdA/CDA1 family)